MSKILLSRNQPIKKEANVAKDRNIKKRKPEENEKDDDEHDDDDDDDDDDDMVEMRPYTRQRLPIYSHRYVDVLSKYV